MKTIKKYCRESWVTASLRFSNESNEYRKWGFEWLINDIIAKIEDTVLKLFPDKFLFFDLSQKLHNCETTYCTACPCIAAIEAKPIWFRKKD